MASILGFALAGASGMNAARADELVVPKAAPAAEAEAAPPPAPANWMNYNARPLTLSSGMLGIHGDIISDLSTGKGGKPVWISPNFYYGVSDRFTIGIAENPDAEFLPVGGGICLAGSYCNNKILNNTSVDALLSLARAPTMEIALHFGADILPFSPFTLDVRGGALMKFAVTGPLALLADPSVSVWVVNRGGGNTEFLNVPVRLGFQVNEQMNAGLVTGVNGYLSGFADNFAIPVGLGLLLTPNEKLDFGASFTLSNAAGHHAAGFGAFTQRFLAITANYRI
jgi:hypothetical protein